jgi:hypothetical protein
MTKSEITVVPIFVQAKVSGKEEVPARATILGERRGHVHIVFGPSNKCVLFGE